MPSGIKGQYFLDLRINGKTLPITATFIHKLEIIQHYKNALPSLALAFIDPSGTLIRSNPIVDGSPIDVAIGKDSNNYKTATRFICYGTPNIKVAPQGSYIELTALLDRPKYIGGQCQRAYQGSSSSAIGQIAAECGLGFSGTGTGDSQTWLPQLVTYSKQASYIADHGYAGGSSALTLGVTEEAELRYKDLMQLAGQNGSRNFYYGPNSNGGVRAIDWKVESLSGMSNYFSGYGLKVYQEDLLKGAMGSFFGNFATRMSGFFNISKSVMGAIGGGRIEKFPMSMGNTHENFAQAVQQNRRMLGMFSVYVTILIEEPSSLNLFDVFNFDLYDNQTRTRNSTYSGSYIVSAVTRALLGTRYVERVTGVTSGLNVDNELFDLF